MAIFTVDYPMREHLVAEKWYNISRKSFTRISKLTVIDKIRKKSGGYISYKFYGVKDLSAGFDVKFVIDNHDFLKNSFTNILQTGPSA